MASKKTNLEDLERITGESNPFITTTNQGNYPVFGAGFLIQGEKLYFSLGTPNFLNPEKFINDSSFIQNQNPILYMAAGYSIDFGFYDSSINPYVTSKIIPGVPNQMSIGGNFNFKNIFEIEVPTNTHLIGNPWNYLRSNIRINCRIKKAKVY